ncbi:TetR/AcrR family transcriptional regulator, partial [Aeromonas media]
MSKIDTKNRILDAAEVLFAERGFADTSLRLITSEADVNLASVNYHFGSKKELIQAVLDRYLSLFMPALDGRLQTLMAQDQLTLLQVFESFVEPLM